MKLIFPKSFKMPKKPKMLGNPQNGKNVKETIHKQDEKR